MTLAVRDPRSAYPAVERLALAPRPAAPDHARYCLIQTMPPGSGLEAPLEAVAAELAARFPQAAVERYMRRDFMIDDPQEREALLARCDAALVLLGPAATMVASGWAFAAALERAGLPLAVALFPGFEAVAAHAAATRAAPLRRAVMPSPVHGAAQDQRDFARHLVDQLLAPLAPEERQSGRVTPQAPRHIAAEGSADELQALFRREGWTDGLPIALPTEAAVQAMLQGTSRRPDEVVTPTLRPESLPTTVEMVAINAAMAGAAPEHLPPILAIVSLYGSVEVESMTRSVNSFAFSHLVGGPIARELGLAGGLNALGPGNYPNAAIARAVALTLRNCGGQRIGVTATPTQGNAAGFTVFAENAAESPWPPFHAADGFAPEDDVVSLFAGGMSILGSFYYRGLDAAAALMPSFDSWAGALLLVSAKRAQALAAEGFDRAGVAEHLWRRATTTAGEFRASGFAPLCRALIARAIAAGREPPWPEDYFTRPAEDVVPAFPRSQVKVAVVGGDVSSVMQLWSSNLQASARVAPWR